MHDERWNKLPRKKDPNGEVGLQLAGAGIAIKHCRVLYDSENRKAIIMPNEEDP